MTKHILCSQKDCQSNKNGQCRSDVIRLKGKEPTEIQCEQYKNKGE